MINKKIRRDAELRARRNLFWHDSAITVFMKKTANRRVRHTNAAIAMCGGEYKKYTDLRFARDV